MKIILIKPNVNLWALSGDIRNKRGLINSLYKFVFYYKYKLFAFAGLGLPQLKCFPTQSGQGVKFKSYVS